MFQASPNVKNCMVTLGLKASAANFRMNVVTGKMVTLSCFFRRGAPNNVYINFERSLPNLTLVNAYLTLGQCQRCRNCVMLHIIRLVLMRQINLFLLRALVCTLDQKAITTNGTKAPYEKHICTM